MRKAYVCHNKPTISAVYLLDQAGNEADVIGTAYSTEVTIRQFNRRVLIVDHVTARGWQRLDPEGYV